MRRRFETYFKRSNYVIHIEKKKNNIIEKETEISNFNSRTLNIDKYKDFIKNKNRINNDVVCVLDVSGSMVNEFKFFKLSLYIYIFI